eukprot:TRINITY_DN20379_c0_g1_i2.p1 TRINITY_DN20379_c0_g1~~TRINITY_DN20379_c0_g1_i2.p1  ORF type:complete len:493 (-),score=42.44 TRINITY_DN20379_c0_g1_i2:795-2273(-)
MYLAKELYEILLPVISEHDGTFSVNVNGGDQWTLQATNHMQQGCQHFVPPRYWKPFLTAHQLNVGDALFFDVQDQTSVEIRRKEAVPQKAPKGSGDIETAIQVVISHGGLSENDERILRAISALSRSESVKPASGPTFDQANQPALIRSDRNVSGFQGVTQCGLKWQAQITRLGRASYIGTFDTPEEAAVAYANASTGWDGAHGAKSRVRRSNKAPHCDFASVVVDEGCTTVSRRLSNADVSGLMFYVNKPLMQIFRGETCKVGYTPDRDTLCRFQLVDEESVRWPMEVKVYSNNHNRYLGRDNWKNLIQGKQLCVNDTLIFRRDGSSLHMEIARSGAAQNLSLPRSGFQDPILADRVLDTRTPQDKCLVSDLAFGREAFPVACVNGVDDEQPPEFVYVHQFVTASGVEVPQNPSHLGFCCDCVGKCTAETCRCMTSYDNLGRLLPLDHRVELCRMDTSTFTGGRIQLSPGFQRLAVQVCQSWNAVCAADAA